MATLLEQLENTLRNLNQCRQPIDSPPLIFIHIPKTAGTSFYNLIEQNYAEENRFVFNINKGKNPIGRLLKQKEKREIRIIYGHGTFGLREIFPEAKYLTFVRHPVSHTLSNYRYIRSSPHNRLHRQVREMSFKEFISNLETIRHDNQHYRQLTNTLFRIEHPEYYSCKISPDYHQLEYAIRTIDYIYRFEEIDAAANEIADEFNWLHSQLETLNRSAREEVEIDEEDIANILSINHLDWHIYRRTDSLLKKQQVGCQGSSNSPRIQ